MITILEWTTTILAVTGVLLNNYKLRGTWCFSSWLYMAGGAGANSRVNGK